MTSSWNLVNSAANSDLPVAQDVEGGLQSLPDPVRRLKEHECSGFSAQGSNQPRRAGPSAAGTPRTQSVGREAGRHQRRQYGAGAGNRFHADAGGHGGPDEAVAGVRHGRRSRIGDQRNAVAAAKPVDQRRHLLVLVVLVQAGRGAPDIVVVQQLGGVARVLGGDQVDVAQHPERPQGDVLEVTDGRGDQEQRSGGGFGHSARSLLYHWGFGPVGE